MLHDRTIKVLLGPSTFGEYDRAPLDRLIQEGYEIIANPYKRKLNKEEVIALLSNEVSGLIAGLETLDKEVFEKTNLKIISRCGSGLSNVDLEEAKRKGIKVYSTPNGPVKAVAELTIGAMLSLIRQISFMDAQMHQGKWVKKTGVQLEGKTIVIIGFGRIGRTVAALLKAFNVKIIVVDPVVTGEETGVELLPLNKALPLADIITIHCSGEHRIIGENELRIMKQGVFLLNAARGGLVDEEALCLALESGKIAGVWMDTFTAEPYCGDLINYPQVLLTPHIGSYTIECRNSMEMEAVNNLITGFKVYNENI